MKVYVDKLPKDCINCSFCEKYGYYLYCSQLCEKLEYFDKEKDCPLKLLTDRLAEERKKVVQEIKNYVCNKYTHIDEEIVNGNHTFFYSMHCRSFFKKLDRIERGEL